MKTRMSRGLFVSVLAMAIVGVSSCVQFGTNSADAGKAAALKEALKNGVINQQEYDSKVAQLANTRAAGVDPLKKAALDKAMKDGLLTQAEYDAKLRAFSAESATPAQAGSGVSTAPSTVLAAAPPAGAGTGVRKEAIRDPGFNMTAFDVTVPANWKFEGAFVPGTSCFQAPFPVVRAYSPDGLTEWRRYPRMDWTWTNLNSASAKAPSHPDCLSLKQELQAQDFIKYIMGVLQIAYVKDSPVPQATIDAKQKFLDQLNASAASNSRILKMEPAVQTASFAGAFGEYRNGSFTIEAHLLSQVECIRAPIPVPNQKGIFSESCNATLRIVRAPKGQLAGVLDRFNSDRVGAFENSEWVTRYLTAFREHSEEMARQRHAEFQRAEAVRAQQHQQFLATMQEGTDRSMARANEAANARHTIASDWCDYALDQQTVTGPGGTVKVSSSFNHTWADGAGNYFQTNDPNANPNGILTGNWSQATKVHGDGTPY